MSVSGAVESGLIRGQAKPKTLELAFTTFLLDARHERNSVENKPASLLVPLEKALSKIPPSQSGRQEAGTTPKRACYGISMAFSQQDDKYAYKQTKVNVFIKMKYSTVL